MAFKMDDWECARCWRIKEHLTKKGYIPDEQCECGAWAWIRVFPAPAAKVREAGRTFHKRKQ